MSLNDNLQCVLKPAYIEGALDFHGKRDVVGQSAPFDLT
ncbi:hypothetical protein CHCC4186_2465 [Bacillus paralicheniformis]|nr:hypothetical protein CHCC4186_2465 [Bacillus paralicheniformis]